MHSTQEKKFVHNAATEKQQEKEVIHGKINTEIIEFPNIYK